MFFLQKQSTIIDVHGWVANFPYPCLQNHCSRYTTWFLLKYAGESHDVEAGVSNPYCLRRCPRRGPAQMYYLSRCCSLGIYVWKRDSNSICRLLLFVARKYISVQNSWRCSVQVTYIYLYVETCKSLLHVPSLAFISQPRKSPGKTSMSISLSQNLKPRFDVLSVSCCNKSLYIFKGLKTFYSPIYVLQKNIPKVLCAV